MRTWIAALVLIVFGSGAHAKPVPDESVHELVMQYIALPCPLLEFSYEYMYNELNAIDDLYNSCLATAQASKNQQDMLKCFFIRQHFELRYDHWRSVEKAYYLMCDPETGLEKQAKVRI